MPAGVVTAKGPLVTPAGANAEMLLLLLTKKLAAAPLNVTLVASRKFLPMMVTAVPLLPMLGVKLVMLAG